MASFNQRCSAVGGYSYANNFILYVNMEETNINVDNNTSQVRYNVYCQSSGSGSISSQHLKYFNINGVNVINTTEQVNASSPNAYIPIATGITDVIQHNADGSKTIDFSTQLKATSYGLSANLSGTFALTTIPRASGISCTTANIEETAIIVINRASANFTHTILYEFGTLSGTIATKTAETNIAWTLPASFYSQIPNDKMGAGTLRCITYNGDTEIGRNAILFYINTSEERCKPTLSATVVDTNSATIASTGSNTKLVKHKSNAKVTITASAKNSATLSSKKVNNSTVTGNEITINAIETDTFVVTVTDSRGYSSSVTLKPTVINYIPLTLNMQIARPEPTTGEVELTYSGNYFNGNFGAIDNTLKMTWKYREQSATDWIDGGTLPTTLNGNTIVKNTVSLGKIFDYTKTYMFQINATDKLTNLEIITFVRQGIPVYNWGKDFFNVNGKLKVKEGAEAAEYKVAGEGTAMCGKAEGHKYRCDWVDAHLDFWVDLTNVGTLSDKRLKTEIEKIDDDFTNAIQEIEIRKFKIANRNGLISFGILAQDLIEIFEKYNKAPFAYEIVYKTQYKLDDDTIYYAINYEQFLILKQLATDRKIKNLEDRIKKLEEE